MIELPESDRQVIESFESELEYFKKLLPCVWSEQKVKRFEHLLSLISRQSKAIEKCVEQRNMNIEIQSLEYGEISWACVIDKRHQCDKELQSILEGKE